MRKQKTDRDICLEAINEAERFWVLQLSLIAQGVIDREMIVLAMDRLDWAHKRALAQCRELM